MINLDTNIKNLNRVGQTTAQILKKLGLEFVSDLLFYFPNRYENFGEVKNIATLEIGQNTNIIGQIDLIQSRRSHGRGLSLTEALINDGSDTIKIIWFNQPYLAKTLKVGDTISLAGKVSENHGQAVMLSPVYEKINAADKELIHTQGLTPIYSLTAKITQKQLRYLIKQALNLSTAIEDWLPNNIKTELGLLDLKDALEKIHFPKNENDAYTARQRLSFSELFLRQLRAQLIKQEIKNSISPEIKFLSEVTKNFVASLPFTLTGDQKKSAWEILQDLEKGQPMSRLLEGDVGSGKTLVAVLAMLNVALNDKQAILMAPTEILARQHFNSISTLLADLNIPIGLITRHTKKSESKSLSQEAKIIIGTHALIQDKINFPDLALIIVDEQHRFGVAQRQKLIRQNNITPHFLSMTATPIPRSLMLAIYGDLKVSIIKEKPKNRLPIITKIVTTENRPAIYKFIAQEISAGHQVFVVCPLIDPSDKLGVKSVIAEHEKLDKEIFPDLKVGLLHGKLKVDAKNEIMQQFLNNEIKILVATSVIEVGVDIPNATIIMIEGAERFGLAQLHQFRGRVGRGNHQSYCFLLPSADQNPKTTERLQALVRHQDGFELAREDLKLRGAGEIYGQIQSGYPELKIASLFDYDLITKANQAAADIIAVDPHLKKYPKIKEILGKWEKNVHLE
jgi:ATP-dependent DNA helicase RecG